MCKTMAVQISIHYPTPATNMEVDGMALGKKHTQPFPTYKQGGLSTPLLCLLQGG